MSAANINFDTSAHVSLTTATFFCPVGRSPLWLAAWHGHSECVKALVNKGADVHTKDAECAPPLSLPYSAAPSLRLLDRSFCSFDPSALLLLLALTLIPTLFLDAGTRSV